MKRCIQWLCFLSLPLLMAGSCSTLPDEDRTLTRDEIRHLLARPKNPRSLYLTVFEGPAGPEFENAHRVHMDQSAQELFIGGEGQPAAIKVYGSSSTPFTALLDPSTPESWTSPGMKYELPLIPLGPPYYQVQSAHLANTEPGFLAYASAIKIESLIVDSALFTIRNHTGDLGPFARNMTGPVEENEPDSEDGSLEHSLIRWSPFTSQNKPSDIDLVLGHQFLQAFSFVRLNYPERTVSFSSTQPYPSPGSRLLVKLPLRVIQGALGTEALIQGKQTQVLLDLAGNYTAAVPENFDSKKMDVYLGDLALRSLAPAPARSLGLTDSKYIRLGWQSLRQFVITLDYQRQAIWFERP